LAIAGLTVVALLIAGVVFRGPIGRAISPPSEPVAYNAELVGVAESAGRSDTQALQDEANDSTLRLVWPYDAQVGTTCASEEAPAVRFTFPDATPRLLRLYISGEDPDDEQGPEVIPGPSVVSIRGTGGCSGLLEVPIEEGWFEYDVEDLVGDGQLLDVFIHDRWNNPNVEAYDVVTIAEVEFRR
jgi:hypothetical protein